MRIIDIIIRFESHLSRARYYSVENSKKDISDYFVYTALAMECFQAVNTLNNCSTFSSRKLYPQT